MKFRIKFINIYYYTFCLIVLIASGSLVAYRIGTNRIDILIVLMGLPFIFKAIMKKKHFEFLIIIGLLLSIYYLINFINYPNTGLKLLRYVSLLLIMIVMTLRSRTYDINIYFVFYRIILFIAAYSLVFFILISILNIPINYIHINPFNSITPYRSYFGVYYSLSAVNLGGIWISRNNSIFWEPGLYQVYLNFALYVNLFIKENKKKKGLIILLLSILSTFSATGIILASILIGYKIIINQKYDSKNIPLKLFISVLLIVTITSMTGNILNEKSQSSLQSFESRKSDIILGLAAFVEKPIIGHGYFNEEIFFRMQRNSNVYWDYNRGNSNGIINIAYMQGIIGLLLYLFPIFFGKKGYVKRSDKIGFILFFIISNMTAPIYQTAFMLLLVGRSYSEL